MYKYLLGILALTLLFTTSVRGQIYQGPLQLGLDFYSVRTVLYAGIDNSFKINSKQPVERWEIIATNGTIKIWGIGDITVTPEKAGKDSIFFYYLSDSSEKKLVSMHVLNVETLPTPQIVLGKNNKISLAELKSLKSLITRIPNLQYYLPFFIKQCKVLTIKATGEKSTYTQTGNVISDDIKKHFQTLQKGDMIII